MKKKLQLKKLGLVMMMSLIVMSVLSVTGYAASCTLKTYVRSANTNGGNISANDGTVEYTSEFSCCMDTNSTALWLTGSVNAKANTDRGSTAGGSINLSVDEKNWFLWLNHSDKVYSQTIVIDKVSYPISYTINSAKGTCSYTKGKTYRGRFEVGYLCAPSNASNVSVYPYMNYQIYSD